MLSANDIILDTTTAANGAWRNINNFTALSVHVVGLESGSNCWIEVSNNPNVLLYQPQAYVPGYNTPGLAPNTSSNILGVPITGNLANNVTYSPPVAGDSGDEQDISFSADGTQCMWSPSCLIWNFIRVCKSGGGSVTTQAFLFGQIG